MSIGSWFLYSEVYSEVAQDVEKVNFEIKTGESVSVLAIRLEQENIIRNPWLFKKYLSFKNLDTKVRAGEFEVEAPITLARVVKAFDNPSFQENEITIIPGWTVRDIAHYFENKQMFQAEELTELVGLPARNYKITADQAPKLDLDLKILQDKPWYVGYEGYFAPDTFRIYKDATIEEIVTKLITHRDSQITEQMWADIEKQGKTFFDILTMASIVEHETNTPEHMAMVADIFWRRNGLNWALQSCATVNYITGKKDPGVSDADREINSAFNTYKYPGLPLGPISNPSIEAIKATIYPKANDYWYFMTGTDGEMRYAKTLEGHNVNVAKYLR